MRLEPLGAATRIVFIFAVLLPRVYSSLSNDELSMVLSSRPTNSSKSLALIRASDTSKRRFGYLDGFGNSGIMEIQGDDLSSFSSKYHAKTKHKFSALFTAVLFAAILSKPLWDTDGSYRIAVAVAVIIYLVESAYSSTRKYLSNMMTPNEVKALLSNLREMRPTLKWDLECYHYRSTYSRSKNGDQSESRTKFTTHRASHEYTFQECIDRTMLQDLLNSLDYDPTSHPFLKISLGTLLLFRDMQSYQDYLNQLSSFMLREGNRDRYTDTSTSLQVPNLYTSKILAIRTVIGDREHVRLFSFWLFTLMGLTVPYRVWFNKHCDDLDVVLTKEVC